MKDKTFKILISVIFGIIVLLSIGSVFIQHYDIEFVDEEPNNKLFTQYDNDNNLSIEKNDLQNNPQEKRQYTDEEIAEAMDTAYFTITLINDQQFTRTYNYMNNIIFPQGFNVVYSESNDGLYAYTKVSDGTDYIVYSLNTETLTVTVCEIFADNMLYKQEQAEEIFNDILLQLVLDEEGIDPNNLINQTVRGENL